MSSAPGAPSRGNLHQSRAGCVSVRTGVHVCVSTCLLDGGRGPSRQRQRPSQDLEVDSTGRSV